MNDRLLRRLRTEQARALLTDADPTRAVTLACDLLAADITTDAVVGLATESARTLPPREAHRHLTAITTELGLPNLDPPTAVTLLAAETCENILNRTISAETGTHTLYVVGHEGSPLTDLLPEVTTLATHLEDNLSGHADTALRHRLDELAHTILTRLKPT